MRLNPYTIDSQEVEGSEPSRSEPSPPVIHNDSPQVRGRSFDQLWGLHPGIALLALVIDTMLFGGALATMGAILPLSLAVGVVLGLITYRAQKRWYGDDDENALIKAAILTVLTVIPTPLPAFSLPVFGSAWPGSPATEEIMIQESAFTRMCKVLAVAFGTALASFLYSRFICGPRPEAYFMGLGTALLVFVVSAFGGVVLYLE